MLWTHHFESPCCLCLQCINFSLIDNHSKPNNGLLLFVQRNYWLLIVLNKRLNKLEQAWISLDLYVHEAILHQLEQAWTDSFQNRIGQFKLVQAFSTFYGRKLVLEISSFFLKFAPLNQLECSRIKFMICSCFFLNYSSFFLPGQ